jgi:hypothetical protein
MPLRTILSCLLCLLAFGNVSAREPVTRAGLLAALTGDKYLGTSADGKLAWLRKSAGTVEPVGGCRATLVILDMRTRAVTASLQLMTPGMMEPAAIPAADLDRALALLRQHGILAGGVEPLALPARLHGAQYSLKTGKEEITLLRNGVPVRTRNVGDNRPDPCSLTGSWVTADRRFLIVGYHRGEGHSRTGIAEREWYDNIVVFDLKR